MKKDLFKARLFSLAGLFGFMLTLASCANEEVVQKATNTDNGNDKNLTTFSAGSPESRTSMDYNSGAFYWEAGDYIYVQDDNNIWRKSKNTPTAKTAFFKFKVDGDFNKNATYKVYYPGKNGINNQVTIPAIQKQAVPNTTTHFGESGDCGTADATGIKGGKYFSFKLDHQAAYLVFLPFTNNKVLQHCFLTKIEVNSDNDITDTYTLDPVTGKLKDIGTGKQIILKLNSDGNYMNGFSLKNTSADVTTNGAFMVIKPGTHKLKIRYWVKDYSFWNYGLDPVEGTITKTLTSHSFDKNKYYNITADLNVRDYDGNHYYQWDAKQQYWYGYEWTKEEGEKQPITNLSSREFYAQNGSDPRYANLYFPGNGIKYNAQTAYFNKLPNANEMSWYAMYGAPHFDADELWSSMGLLYKGGVWLKKKSVLIADGNYSTEYSADGITDMRTTYKDYGNNSMIMVPPSTAEANNYFYLPFLGCYINGSLLGLGMYAWYWSSSAEPRKEGIHINAYYLAFEKGSIGVVSYIRQNGNIAQPFSDFGDN